MKLANIVVYQAADGKWTPILPADTPEWVKEPEVMGDMIAGAIVERDGQFFRARKVSDSKLVLHDGRVTAYRRPTIQ